MVFTNVEFDVAELCLISYLSQVSRGECKYIGIPYFYRALFDIPHFM